MKEQVGKNQKWVFKDILWLPSSQALHTQLLGGQLYQPSPWSHVGGLSFFPQIGFSNFHLKEDGEKEGMTWSDRKINNSVSKSFWMKGSKTIWGKGRERERTMGVCCRPPRSAQSTCSCYPRSGKKWAHADREWLHRTHAWSLHVEAYEVEAGRCLREGSSGPALHFLSTQHPERQGIGPGPTVSQHRVQTRTWAPESHPRALSITSRLLTQYLQYLVLHDRQNSTPPLQICPRPNPQSLWICTSCGKKKKRTSQMWLSKGFWEGRLSWITGYTWCNDKGPEERKAGGSG